MGHLSKDDIDSVSKYLNTPEMILLINDLLIKEVGTIPESDWTIIKYTPINPYID